MKSTALLFLFGVIMANLEVAPLFTDRAVLQRDMPINVWGRSAPETTITVKFKEQTAFCKTDANGDWLVELTKFPASVEGASLTVEASDGASVVFSDVVVGEVWICSGQSNMHMPLSYVPEVEALVPKIKNVRSFMVPQEVSFEEEFQMGGSWREGNPDSAVATSFAYHLEELTDVPVGIIQTAWGSSSIEGWMPRSLTKSLPHFASVMEKFDGSNKTKKKISKLMKLESRSRQDDIFLRTKPNILYNAMMHPLIPYSCRGIAWYQGEANSNNIKDSLQYRESLQAWIQEYRQRWQREDFHLMVVTLPGLGKLVKSELPKAEKNSDPNAYSWAWMRESQYGVLDLDHTSAINNIDLGETNNLHPKDKLPIGKRLALKACSDTLQMKQVSQGPEAEKVEIQAHQLVVIYPEHQVLKTIDGESPREFWIADDHQQWVMADAVLQGNRILLSSGEIASPKYVRYAFSGKPNVNLVGSAMLPARPFRTDTFIYVPTASK